MGPLLGVMALFMASASDRPKRDDMWRGELAEILMFAQERLMAAPYRGYQQASDALREVSSCIPLPEDHHDHIRTSEISTTRAVIDHVERRVAEMLANRWHNAIWPYLRADAVANLELAIASIERKQVTIPVLLPPPGVARRGPGYVDLSVRQDWKFYATDRPTDDMKKIAISQGVRPDLDDPDTFLSLQRDDDATSSRHDDDPSLIMDASRSGVVMAYLPDLPGWPWGGWCAIDRGTRLGPMSRANQFLLYVSTGSARTT
jgi:hypothetical protein